MTKKHIANIESLNKNQNNNFVLNKNEPHNKSYLCNCGKDFSREDNYLRHCRNYCPLKRNIKQNICQFCGKNYSTNFNLNKHIKKCKKKTK